MYVDVVLKVVVSIPCCRVVVVVVVVVAATTATVVVVVVATGNPRGSRQDNLVARYKDLYGTLSNP